MFLFIGVLYSNSHIDSVKNKLANLPLLKQPDFKKPFELHCDAAITAGIGVILCQKFDGVTAYPLAFASRALSKQEQRYSIREIEALAVVWGIKKFRMFLECNKFYIYTDHSFLKWLLNTSQDKQPRLWRWCMFLQSYNFEVIYVKGTANVVADLLSRNPMQAITTEEIPLSNMNY